MCISHNHIVSLFHHFQNRTEIQGKSELNIFSLSTYHAHHPFQHPSLFRGGKEGEHLPDPVRTGEHSFVCCNPVCYNSLSPQIISYPGLMVYVTTVQANQASICFFTILSPAMLIVSLTVINSTSN